MGMKNRVRAGKHDVSYGGGLLSKKHEKTDRGALYEKVIREDMETKLIHKEADKQKEKEKNKVGH